MLSDLIVGPGDEQWLAVLAEADHDFYHLPCYQELTSATDETARGYLASDGTHKLLLPFQQRTIPADLAEDEQLFDVNSAYGYPGPIWSRGAPREFVATALRQFSVRLADEGIVSAFFRLHTLLNDAAFFEGVGEIVSHGPSVYIDLTLSEEELWAQTRRGHKRDLAALEKRGYEIIMNEWDRIDDFLTCYYDSMRRLGASPFYFFPKSYFESLRSCLGNRLHLCLVYLDGDIACAGLVTEMDGICQYHLSATADPHFQDHPSKLMLHYLRTWLKRRGNRIFNVGGGVGALRDTLHLFKSGFSPLSAAFHTWRVIPDRQRYDELVDRRFGAGVRSPDNDEDAFFPLYRAPVADA